MIRKLLSVVTAVALLFAQSAFADPLSSLTGPGLSYSPLNGGLLSTVARSPAVRAPLPSDDGTMGYFGVGSVQAWTVAGTASTNVPGMGFGNGYVQNTTTCTVSAAPVTANTALCNAVVYQGSVIAVEMSYVGQGYTTVPTITLADTSGGTGATVTLTGITQLGSLWNVPGVGIWRMIDNTPYVAGTSTVPASGGALWSQVIPTGLPCDVVQSGCLAAFGGRQLTKTYTGNLMDVYNGYATKTLGIAGSKGDLDTVSEQNFAAGNIQVTASGQGSISGSGTMTITAINSGTFYVGQTINAVTSTGVPVTETLTALGTGTGGTGTYTVNGATLIASTAITGSNVNLTLLSQLQGTAGAVSNGGSGYVSGDVGKQFTVSGGTTTPGGVGAALGIITAVSGGAVTGFEWQTGGQYLIPPPEITPTTSSNTTGTGLTITSLVAQWSPANRLFVSKLYDQGTGASSGCVQSMFDQMPETVPGKGLGTTVTPSFIQDNASRNGSTSLVCSTAITGVLNQMSVYTVSRGGGGGSTQTAFTATLNDSTTPAHGVGVEMSSVPYITYPATNMPSTPNSMSPLLAGVASGYGGSALLGDRSISYSNQSSDSVAGLNIFANPAIAGAGGSEEQSAVMVFNHTLTLAEVANLQVAVVGTFGLQPQVKQVVIFTGDDRTMGKYGEGLRNQPNSVLETVTNQPFRMVNSGNATGTTVYQLANFYGLVGRDFQFSNVPPVCWIWEGAYDINALGSAPSAVLANLQTMYNVCTLLGAPWTIMHTEIQSSAFTSTVNNNIITLEGLIRSTFGVTSNYPKAKVADYANLPQFGNNGGVVNNNITLSGTNFLPYGADLLFHTEKPIFDTIFSQ